MECQELSAENERLVTKLERLERIFLEQSKSAGAGAGAVPEKANRKSGEVPATTSNTSNAAASSKPSQIPLHAVRKSIDRPDDAPTRANLLAEQE